MNPQFPRFLATYLDLEQAFVVTGSLRTTLHACNAAYGEAVRDGLAALLESRELSADDYEGITGVEFEDEESLYTYLQGMYAHLFGERPDQPVPTGGVAAAASTGAVPRPRAGLRDGGTSTAFPRPGTASPADSGSIFRRTVVSEERTP